MEKLFWMVPLVLLVTALLIRRLKADAEKRHTRAIVKKRLKNLNMYFLKGTA